MNNCLTVDGLTFLVRQHPGNKHLRISINADGLLAVSAPPHLDNAQILNYLNDNIEWAHAHVNQRLLQLSEKPVWTFTDGDMFPYQGTDYPLRHDPACRAAGIMWDNGEFRMHPKEHRQARKHFISWYTAQAMQHLSAHTRSLCWRHAFLLLSVEIADLKTKWGSCATSGKIMYDYHLIMMPPSVADYVVAHEVAHLTVPHHRNEFWTELERLMPNYAEHQDWLDQNGHKYIF